MSYITILQLAESPGALELAQVASTSHEAIVDAELMDLTLRGGNRSAYTAPQIAAADEALARINEVIVETDEFIDGFLGKRYALPLTAPLPKMLTVWSRAIVRYQLHKDLNADDRSNPIVRGYRDALKLLQQIANGEFSLGVTDPNAPSNDNAVQFETPTKVFRREQLDRFR